MPSITSALPRPRKPRPMRRLAMASRRCSGSGHQVTSSTLSNMRTAVRTTSLNPVQSKPASDSKARSTNRVRSMEPRQQQP